MVLAELLLPILFLIGKLNAFPEFAYVNDRINSIFITDQSNFSQPIPEPSKYKSCGLERECVPRFLCKNDRIVDDGENIIDIRIHTDVEEPQSCGYLETCCDVASKVKDPVIPPVPLVQHDGCGYRNPQGVAFRISGDTDNEAQYGEFPWMVAILDKEVVLETFFEIYKCGGALIAPTVVITAAHCVQKDLSADHTLVVRAGEWDTQTTSEILPVQDRHVREIIRHEKFMNRSLQNDIALLFMDAPFVYQENIRPICLPPRNINFDFSRCYATGWGKDKYGREGKYQVILKKMELPVVPSYECQRNLRMTRLSQRFRLHESFICAGGEAGKDMCLGDGGSPLVCPTGDKNGQFFHAGIVAWGIGCGDANIPGVYVNVAHLRPWINEKLSHKGIDFSDFTA